MNREQKIIYQRAAFRKWYAKNREFKLEQNRAWKASHKEHLHEYNVRYYASHRDKMKAQHLAWYYKNREKVIAYQKEYSRTHSSHRDIEHRREYARKWYKLHKAKKVVHE